jgi:hypothetical protein
MTLFESGKFAQDPAIHEVKKSGLSEDFLNLFFTNFTNQALIPELL